jgi:hypothetical protein
MVGGSNLGELFGAAFVFIFTNTITTPMPWLRFDALALLILWYLPYWYPRSGEVQQAWIVAATFIPIVSFSRVERGTRLTVPSRSDGPLVTYLWPRTYKLPLLVLRPKLQMSLLSGL